MQAPEKSQIGKFVLLFLAVMFIIMCSSEKPGPPQVGLAVTLPAVEVEAFGTLPPSQPAGITPSLKDQASTVDNAVNYNEIMAFLGVRLTPEQEKFLNEHKFLLIPKSATRFKGKVDLGKGGGFKYDEMLGLFDYTIGETDPIERKPENSRFVNPDVMLHALHKYLENSLIYLEKRELAETLRRFLTNIQAKALEYQAATPRKLAEHYELIGAQLTVPLVILENARWPSSKGKIQSHRSQNLTPDDGDTLESALKILDRFKGRFSESMFNRMTLELRLIYGVRDLAPSPLYGQYAKNAGSKGDYTQFTPRSHYAESSVLRSYFRAIPLYGQYAKNEAASGDYTQFAPWGHYVESSVLRSYFRAMMYLGRNGYILGKEEGVTDALLVALLMAGTGSDGKPLLKDWQRIMEITSFFAGKPDDIGYPEWRKFLITVLGTERLSAGEALNPATLAKITQRLGELKGPQVFSEVINDPEVFTSTKEQLLEDAKAFRICGQRFSFDGWILNRLTAGQEKTAVRLPSMPSGLFIPAALGDKTAQDFVDQYLKSLSPPFSSEETPRFNGRLNEVAADLVKVKDPEWSSSLNTMWLKLLGTLTFSYGKGYPLYMQDKLFPVKQVETFLGSYTEFKHDTLLYTKQAFAEEGDEKEGTPPPVPKGFVEPNLSFWETLGRLVAYVEAGYRKYGLFKDEQERYGKLNRFKQAVAFYTSLAAKELQGTPITEGEYEKMRLEPLMYMAVPFGEGQVLEKKDMRSGLIADLYTDTLQGRILYEATNEPYIMLVLTGNEGTVRLAIGTAFNHYEFTGPLATRYTDADWQRRVYEHPSELPEKNFWYKSLATQ